MQVLEKQMHASKHGFIKLINNNDQLENNLY